MPYEALMHLVYSRDAFEEEKVQGGVTSWIAIPLSAVATIHPG
jgi:hypothetical protein